jgi:hypothetical protein
MSDELPTAYYPLSVLRDLMPELREQERAREAGITYDAVRAILADWRLDDGDSFGRTIERLRTLALEAAERMSEAERQDAYDALLTEVETLREQRRIDNEEAARLYDFARDKGQALERAAVVAWLREHGEHYHERNHHRAEALWDAADAIERGEHRREEEP